MRGLPAAHAEGNAADEPLTCFGIPEMLLIEEEEEVWVEKKKQ